MKVENIQEGSSYFMILDVNNETNFLTTSELQKWLDDGSIQQGDLVVSITVNEIKEAKSKIYLP